MKQAWQHKKLSEFKQTNSLFIRVCLFTVILLAGTSGKSNAQITKIEGQVVDAQTKKPVPYANVYEVSSLQGTLTDDNGHYSLKIINKEADSLRASLLGYRQVTKPVVRGRVQTINFELYPQNENLPEVVIKYTGNPADALIDSIIKHKKENSFQAFQTCRYDAYSKTRMDVNNVSEKMLSKGIMKHFNFLLDHMDTSHMSGKTYLPVMITETKSVIYERKSPPKKKEIVTATKISGIENNELIKMTGDITLDVNIYDNYTQLFEKNFVSPVADFAHAYYRYYLIDSAFIRDKWCYHILFKPKRKQDLAYSGGLWVNDTTYSIVNIKMRIAEDANINLVNDLGVEQYFTKVNDHQWMKTKEKIFIDFNPIEKTRKIPGVYAERTNIFSHFVFDTLVDEKIFNMPESLKIEEDAAGKTEIFWDTIRPELLSHKEQGVYEMIDSIKKVPVFKLYRNFSYGITTGYFPWGKFEVGPYYKLFSYNEIEGGRFRIGGRTSTKLSKKINVEAYLAYGIKDQRFKGGVDLIYLPKKEPRRAFYASFKSDMEQMGKSPTSKATDNLLSSVFSRGPIDKLTMVRQYEVAYEHEWFSGLINTFVVNRREMFPLGDAKFVIFPETQQDTVFTTSITTTEIGLDTRISFKETYIEGKFRRATIKSKYPIFLISYRYGIPLAQENNYNYNKLTLGIEQWFHLGTIGWSRFRILAGKIWGTLPYPLLKIHNGNETWIYDDYSANLMNYYEFVSDRYVNFYYTHHFDGFFFNKIPGVRKLKLREVIYFRGLYGGVSPENMAFSEFPEDMRSFGNEPYLETGAGIENIFKMLQIYAIWRLTHLDDPQNPDVKKFGIFASIYFSF
jgi:hypothetical protein